jgi:hypothetical protein
LGKGLHQDASLARRSGALPGKSPKTLIHNFCKPHARIEGFQIGKIEIFKSLILMNLNFSLSS